MLKKPDCCAPEAGLSENELESFLDFRDAIGLSEKTLEKVISHTR